MADTATEKPAYVNPYQELYDKAKGNFATYDQAAAQRKQSEAQTQAYQQAQQQNGAWQALVNALMQKRKQQQMLGAAQQIPNLNAGGFGG